MVLFSAAIRSDYVSLPRLPFLSHIQVFLCAISPIFFLVYPYSIFSCHFCFPIFVVFLFVLMLLLLWQALVINVTSLFLCFPQVCELMHQCNTKCWIVLFHFLLLIYLISLCHISAVLLLQLLLILTIFSHQLTLMVFHWSLSDSMSPQVSRTLRNILANLNNAVVWIVCSYDGPPISNSTNPFTKPLWVVTSTLITIGTNITFMFHNCLVLWQGQDICLSSFSLIFSLWSAGMAKFTIRQVLFFVNHDNIWSSGRD